MKACGSCGDEKPLGAFCVNRLGKFGRHSKCRACQKRDHAEYYLRVRPAPVRFLTPRIESAERSRHYKKRHPDRACAAVAKRRAAQMQRTPPWADPTAIAAIYAEARRLTIETGVPHEVDHFYPLRGKTISGLHCEANLRVIPAMENRKKWAHLP